MNKQGKIEVTVLLVGLSILAIIFFASTCNTPDDTIKVEQREVF